MKIENYKKEGFEISTDKSKLDIEVVHNFLTNCDWAKNVTFGVVKKSIRNSFCFGVYKNNNQIGFARIITDYATIAYLADVFILEKYRNLGLSKWLMEVIITTPELQGIRRWMLKTLDAHGLYEKYGFVTTEFPDRIMEFSPNKK